MRDCWSGWTGNDVSNPVSPVSRVLVRTLRNTLCPDDVTRVILARNRICYEQQRDSPVDEDEVDVEKEEDKYTCVNFESIFFLLLIIQNLVLQNGRPSGGRGDCTEDLKVRILVFLSLSPPPPLSTTYAVTRAFNQSGNWKKWDCDSLWGVYSASHTRFLSLCLFLLSVLLSVFSITKRNFASALLGCVLHRLTNIG